MNILRWHIPVASLNTTYVCQSTHRIFRKDRATYFGCKRIAVMRTELQDTKLGLITIVIGLEILAFTIKLLVYCKKCIRI
jgi:hypothetical protein